ncbi:hypothetical protein SCHPADRAFT_484511 [Schizopora paradoxa]|uniref:Zn(2)-C6 fungal-type domain-containing protein n=1 Tax=Schizopora paradoxa TaxID=27342 RepID=A0A0H2RH35_9AGAM|nr:hypothetical protein SCHPADRAFT_484511 [Schizopora paradoxa]
MTHPYLSSSSTSGTRPTPCEPCRKLKRRCGGRPGQRCLSCVKRGIECIYEKKETTFIYVNPIEPRRPQRQVYECKAGSSRNLRQPTTDSPSPSPTKPGTADMAYNLVIDLGAPMQMILMTSPSRENNSDRRSTIPTGERKAPGAQSSASQCFEVDAFAEMGYPRYDPSSSAPRPANAPLDGIHSEKSVINVAALQVQSSLSKVSRHGRDRSHETKAAHKDNVSFGEAALQGMECFFAKQRENG